MAAAAEPTKITGAAANALLKGLDLGGAQPKVDEETYRQTVSDVTCGFTHLGMTFRIYGCTFKQTLDGETQSYRAKDGLEMFKGMEAAGILGDRKSAEQLECVRPIKGPVYPDSTVCTILRTP